MNEPKPLEKPRDIMTDTLVKRLLSGKPTPLEREAGEALFQAQTRADEWHKNFLEVSKHEQRARARCAEMEKFRKFAGLLLFDYCENWGTDIGGDMIEEYLLKSGLAARKMVTEPCGEYCQCADINDFPLECNRLSKEAMLAKHDIPDAALKEPK